MNIENVINYVDSHNKEVIDLSVMWLNMQIFSELEKDDLSISLNNELKEIENDPLYSLMDENQRSNIILRYRYFRIKDILKNRGLK